MRVSGCSVRCGQHVTTGAFSWVAQSLQGLLTIFMELELFAAERGGRGLTMCN